MRNVDQRPVSENGGGASARPLLGEHRGGFVDVHDLWTEQQYAAATQLRRVVDELGIEMVRLGFVDQHGIVRGKTIARAALAAALRSGITAPSSLLLKDTSGRSVFPVFRSDVGVGIEGFSGAGDIVLVPDPTTFRVVPWVERTGWLLCDVRFPDGQPVPFCTRSLLRDQLGRLADRGYAMTVGAELEFHLFRGADQATTPGSQLLHEETLDGLDEVVQRLYAGLTALDLPVRTLELEFGPSQLEITLDAADAATTADAVTVCRTAIRQIVRRLGYHVTFMSRPHGAAGASTGWHLHQSLRHLATGRAAFAPDESDAAGAVPLSVTGRAYLEGLLANAAAAAAFTTPTVNGYKRYQPYSLAPDRVAWGLDNKGAMVRAVLAADPSATRLENRSGEPAANPYLYVASQVVSGLDGLERRLELRPPTENPYEDDDAPRLPRSLGAAVDALDASATFRAGLGDTVVDWFVRIKRAEFDRYLAHVSDWEQHEYADLF